MKRYEQIVADIKKNIQNNKYKPGDKLPSLLIMAQQYQVSKGTILKAYETLEKQCLIFSKPQSGYYIADGIRIQLSVTSPDFKEFFENLINYVLLLEKFREIKLRGANSDDHVK